MAIKSNYRPITVSIGNTRRQSVWTRSRMEWSEFCARLGNPVISAETYDEYMHMTKSQQDELKDVGGFVGGTFTGDRRKASNVEGRDLITLDLDNIPSGMADDIRRRVAGLSCAAAIYSTRKHSGYKPRLRIVVPTDRTMTADEYEPIARKMAQIIGIEYCDPTTFEASRLMYWPSRSSDGEYICDIIGGNWCSADGILNMYGDWHDVAQWAQVPGSDTNTLIRRKIAKQEDPTSKRGIVGAFCRVYNITSAMDKFIAGVYTPTEQADRYTYVGGSTVGGAVVYDNDTFLFSHHATDPCSGQLVNAYDLIRLHKFAELDDNAKEGTPSAKLPSYLEMAKLASNDREVADLLARERVEQAQNVFDTPAPTPTATATAPAEPGDLSWTEALTKDQNGKIEKTMANAVIVLEGDAALKGVIVIDEFASRSVVLGPLPWDQRNQQRQWTDADYSGYYLYMEAVYGITGKDKLDNALVVVSNRHKVNFVRDYLAGLKWDGHPRVDTLLTDYLGAPDGIYTRAVMRKSLVAAVARAIVGGVKYDYMPILTGPQGIGKSSFLSILGREWFSDSLTSFEGKEAAELIQGTWINEVGELTAFNRQETNAVKQFLSKKVDRYRAAYGRVAADYPRRCVFFGTCNESEFLKDSTGNRRFWPVDVGLLHPTKNVWEQLPDEVDQIWAEAYARWQCGEPLHLNKEQEAEAVKMQERHSEQDAKLGIIQEYLDRRVPPNWEGMAAGARRLVLSSELEPGDDYIERTTTSVAEVWVECLHGDIKFIRRQDSMEIAAAIKSLGWVAQEKPKRSRLYGLQKIYVRPS